MILVTGGAGYIGSHTIIELLKKNNEIIILDNFSNSEKYILKNISAISSKPYIFENVDVSDLHALDNLFKKYEIHAVIHFAAYKSVGESVKNPLAYYSNNIGGLVSLLKCCEKYDVNKFIFSSSCTVYGEPSEQKIGESSKVVKPSSPYGNTKKICEEIIEDYSKGTNFKAILLRYFNPVGAHESGLLGDNPKGIPNNLIPYLTKVVNKELPHLNVFGNDYNTPDGTCIRDYIHVSELAEAHVKALEYVNKIPKGSIDAINLGTGQGNSVLEVINAFEEATGKKVNYKFSPRRPGDVEAIFANPSKAKKELGWEAKLTLKDMMKSAWNYQMTNNKEN